MMGRAAQTPGLKQVFSLFESSTPQLYLDIDRTKAQMLGINLPDVFGALQTYLGSYYVNDFNLLGRTFRVTAQAEDSYRLDPKDVLQIRVSNSNGSTVPLGSFTTVQDVTGPYRMPRYNLYSAAELDGAPSASSRSRPASAAGDMGGETPTTMTRSSSSLCKSLSAKDNAVRPLELASPYAATLEPRYPLAFATN
jgi:multidrug efflux pump subunit AcrB